MIADMHTHSRSSFDAEEPVKALCRSAARKGVGCFAVTDHCEIAAYRSEHFDEAMESSYREVAAARRDFAGQVELLAGVELGFYKKGVACAERAAAAYPYDVVLGSLHNLADADDFAFLDYKGMDVPGLLARYFDEMYEMVCWGGFDVLTHMTYPLRYICGVFGIPVELSDYRAQVEKIFREIIRRGIALEINTSGLRQPYGRPLPDAGSLALYRSLGGRLVTVGSDAHTARDLGANLADGMRLAREAGFDSLCLFRGRRPVEYPIQL